MTDDFQFRRAAQTALSSLKRHLVAREQEEQTRFEVEENAGVLNVLFDDLGARFAITPHTPLRQIWITAHSTSLKLIWDSKMEEFLLPRTGETLTNLVDRLIGEYHAPSPSHI